MANNEHQIVMTVSVNNRCISRTYVIVRYKDCKVLLNLFFQFLYLESGFLSVAYLTVANLARLGISVHCQVSVRFQYLVRLISQCRITDGHTIRPPIEELLPPTGIEPTPFRNSTSKVAGLQVDASTPVRHFI